MGMYDDVYFEADLPPGHPEAERTFQTKSVFNCLDRLTITKEGRLILHAARYEPDDLSDDILPSMTRIEEGEIDLEFHGDVRLTSLIEDRYIQYVARFTHGTLEWIRPWSELSETHRSLLNASR